jgi:hypothetical protein
VEWRKLCTSLFLDLDLSEFLPYKNKLIGRIETLTKREEKKSERKGRLQKEDKKKVKRVRWRKQTDLLLVLCIVGISPDPMQVAIPVLLIISASPTNNTPPPRLPSSLWIFLS